MLRPHVPDLIALQLLVEVSKTGSLSRAAKTMGVTQQAVSARMRACEALIGTELVVRSPRGSTLTVSGQVMAGWAAEVIAAAERMDAGIASLRSETMRELKVAASLTIVEYLLPRWLVALRTRQESTSGAVTQVGMTATNSDTVVELVRSGAVPLGFIETSMLPSGLSVRALGHDELTAVVAPEHPWARRSRPVDVRELAATSLVAREPGSGTRQTLENLLLSVEGITELAAPRVELSSTAAVRTAIAAGTTPGVLSSLAIADELTLGRLVAVPISGVSLRRQLSAIWRMGKNPPHGPAQDLVAVALTH